MFGAAAAVKNTYNPYNDMEVAVPPDMDGISSIGWSPVANHLVASSWNNSVYVWDVLSNGQTQPKAQNKDHQQPVLCTSWSHDGTQVYTGGCDKTARLWNLATNQSTQVCTIAAATRCASFCSSTATLARSGMSRCHAC